MTIEHDMSYLDDIKAESAYELAREADCGSPDHRESAGALVLAEVRDDVVSAWGEGRFAYDSQRDDLDVVAEVANGCIPEDYSTFWQAFIDLAIYREESPFSSNGEWSGSFNDMGREAMSEVVERLGMYVIGAVRKALGDWVCPLCGDTGNPRICYPGDCRSSDEEQAEYQAQQASQVAAGAPGHGLGIHPRAEAPEAVSDPIPTPIAQVETEAGEADAVGPHEPSVTQAFMASMSAANIAEFGERRRKVKRIKIMTCVLVILTGAAIIASALAGVL